ncbi:6,7-dimethyl-8-ribityllumazine synthase [Pelagibius sp. Alg239-R121]|uniref:6,7-dimethyl-8-ribityllumazine synthase n=1 Tax=Pelagibius sp. Alg239-R121 TaxID=2993448 RepID=UPI0024A618A7|nr:6,7-dimethyl-8-ribityllumazine synthase [Pelagibius sp. Alg239-R121]
MSQILSVSNDTGSGNSGSGDLAGSSKLAKGGPRARIAFIKAGWHSDIVDQSHAGFLRELETLDQPTDSVDVFQVPGAYEIPLQAKRLANSGDYAIIVAAAFVVDGGIYRHEFVSDAVVSGMMQVQLETEVPILSVVLTPKTFQESPEQIAFFSEHFVTKGAEAARACVATLENQRTLIALAS